MLQLPVKSYSAARDEQKEMTVSKRSVCVRIVRTYRSYASGREERK